jgi:hypothetical protein
MEIGEEEFQDDVSLGTSSEDESGIELSDEHLLMM